MASLRSPLTIVARGSPAATWFDDQLHHFVALEAASNQGEDGSVTTGIVTLDSAAFGSNCSNDDSTLVSYQAYGIPKGDSQQTPVDSAGQSAFDAGRSRGTRNIYLYYLLTSGFNGMVLRPSQLPQPRRNRNQSVSFLKYQCRSHSHHHSPTKRRALPQPVSLDPTLMGVHSAAARRVGFLFSLSSPKSLQMD